MIFCGSRHRLIEISVGVDQICVNGIKLVIIKTGHFLGSIVNLVTAHYDGQDYGNNKRQ